MEHSTPEHSGNSQERRRKIIRDVTQVLISSLFALILFAACYFPSIFTGTA